MDSKISQLAELLILTGQEYAIVATGGVNKKVSLGLILSGISNPNVTLVALGLENVDNTRDIDKPVSTAVLTALGLKAEAVHGHTASEITDLAGLLLAKANVTDLNSKAEVAHQHTINDVINLQVALDDKVNIVLLTTKADAVHSHAISDTAALQTVLDAKAPVSHGHAITDVTSLQTTLNNKSETTHVHAVSDIDTLSVQLAAKAALSHAHTVSEITDINTVGLPEFEATIDPFLQTGGTIGISVDVITMKGYYTPTVNIAAKYKAVGDVVWTAIGSEPFVDGTLIYTGLQVTGLANGSYDVEIYMTDSNNPLLDLTVQTTAILGAG